MVINYSDLYNSNINDLCDKVLNLFNRCSDKTIRRCIKTRIVTYTNDMIRIGGSDPESWDGGYFYVEITKSDIKFRASNGFAGASVTVLYSYDSDGNVSNQVG